MGYQMHAKRFGCLIKKKKFRKEGEASWSGWEIDNTDCHMREKCRISERKEFNADHYLHPVNKGLYNIVCSKIEGTSLKK